MPLLRRMPRIRLNKITNTLKKFTRKYYHLNVSSALKDFQAELTFKDISSRAIWLKMLKKARDQCDKRFKSKLRLENL